MLDSLQIRRCLLTGATPRYLLALVALLLFCQVHTASADRALLVGINAYTTEHPDPPEDCGQPCLAVKPLAGAVADVEIIRKLLVDTLDYRAEDVRILVDRDATAARILREIDEWLVRGTQPGERAFFHFSGHGLQVADDGDDEADKLDESIIPIDVKVDRHGNVQNLIRDDQLKIAFSGLKGRRFTAVFDSCFSGTVTRSAHEEDSAVQGRTPADFQHWLLDKLPASRGPSVTLGLRAAESALLDSEPGWTFWSAASANQVAWDTEQPLGGVFTRLLAEEIRNIANGNGSSHAAVLDRLQTKSRGFCKQIGKCHSLVPTLEISRDKLGSPLATSLMPQPVYAPPITVLDAATSLLPSGAGTTDGRTVKVTMSPGTTVRLGQSLQYQIVSDVAGQLLVFDARPSGSLVQLIPNVYKPNARVTTGNSFRTPVKTDRFALTAEAPIGSGRVIVVVSDGSIDFSDLAVTSRGLEVVTEPRDFLAEIAARLRKARLDGQGGVRLVDWAVGAVDYEITP